MERNSIPLLLQKQKFKSIEINFQFHNYPNRKSLPLLSSSTFPFSKKKKKKKIDSSPKTRHTAPRIHPVTGIRTSPQDQRKVDGGRIIPSQRGKGSRVRTIGGVLIPRGERNGKGSERSRWKKGQGAGVFENPRGGGGGGWMDLCASYISLIK